MPNTGWPSEAGGSEDWSSTQRTTGRDTACADAESFIKGSDAGSPGDNSGDAMGDRDDLYEVRGQMSTS